MDFALDTRFRDATLPHIHCRQNNYFDFAQN